MKRLFNPLAELLLSLQFLLGPIALGQTDQQPYGEIGSIINSQKGPIV